MEVDISEPYPLLGKQNVNISGAHSSALFCILCNAPCSCGQPPTSHFFFSMGLDGKAVTSPIAIKIVELLVGEINDSDDACEALSQFPSHVVCRFCFRTLTNLIEEEERLKNRISALKTRLARTLAKHDMVILGLTVPAEELRPPNTPNTMILTKTPFNKPSLTKRLEVIPAQLSNPISNTSVKENLISAFAKVETIIDDPQNTLDNVTSEEASSSSNQGSGQPKAKNLFYIPVSVHECETCSEVFTCKSSLLAHQEQHSNVREGAATQNGTSLKGMGGVLEHSGELYRCRLCIQEFSALEAREQHEKTHKTYLYCKACDVYFKKRDELVEHRTTCQIHSSRFMCEHCGKGFPNSNSLTIHLRTHTGEKPFKCPECDMTFSQVANMRAHVRTTHLQERPHECNLCGRAFKRRRMLENHTRSVHTGERPFQCEVCLASFAYVEHMRKHKLIHSDNKPYVCEICGKGFSNRDNRNTHRFTHTDRKPYECKECGARFLRKPQLLQHLQVSQHGDPETAGAAVKITQVISEPAESDEERPTLSTDECLESNSGQPQPMSIMISDSDGKPIYVEVMPHSEDVMEAEEETLDSMTLEMAQDLVDVTLDL